MVVYSPDDVSWAFSSELDESIVSHLTTPPGRWGRMTSLSRLLIVETGRLLLKEEIIQTGQKCSDIGLTVGLVGATRNGSYMADKAFIETMKQGVGMASPALFGYTLPNIALAEVANQFGLIGPVYALFDGVAPLEKAVMEAHKLLEHDSELSFMLGCEFDHTIENSTDRTDDALTVTLTLVKKNEDSNACLSKVE